MKHISLILIIIIALGCKSTDLSIKDNSIVDKNEFAFENIEKINFEPSVLTPDYDIKDLRIDIIRQTDGDDCDTDDVDYHSVGFYLGNGLFVDFNNNISLLVPELLEIDDHDNFTLIKTESGIFSDHTITYQSMESEFVTQSDGLFNINTRKIIDRKDSEINVEDGLFSKYTIHKTDSSMIYKSFMSNRIIEKTDKGYKYEAPFQNIAYNQIGNDIHIGNSYIIRNRGDVIEILSKGLFNKEYLRIKIIKTEDSIQVYNRRRQLLEINKTKQALTVSGNARRLCTYALN